MLPCCHAAMLPCCHAAMLPSVNGNGSGSGSIVTILLSSSAVVVSLDTPLSIKRCNDTRNAQSIRICQNQSIQSEFVKIIQKINQNSSNSIEQSIRIRQNLSKSVCRFNNSGPPPLIFYFFFVFNFFFFFGFSDFLNSILGHFQPFLVIFSHFLVI
jgi:hypothetical protein